MLASTFHRSPHFPSHFMLLSYHLVPLQLRGLHSYTCKRQRCPLQKPPPAQADAADTALLNPKADPLLVSFLIMQ